MRQRWFRRCDNSDERRRQQAQGSRPRQLDQLPVRRETIDSWKFARQQNYQAGIVNWVEEQWTAVHQAIKNRQLSIKTIALSDSHMNGKDLQPITCYSLSTYVCKDVQVLVYNNIFIILFHSENNYYYTQLVYTSKGFRALIFNLLRESFHITFLF